jgi:hypothetical protein
MESNCMRVLSLSPKRTQVGAVRLSTAVGGRGSATWKPSAVIDSLLLPLPLPPLPRLSETSYDASCAVAGTDTLAWIEP